MKYRIIGYGTDGRTRADNTPFEFDVVNSYQYAIEKRNKYIEAGFENVKIEEVQNVVVSVEVNNKYQTTSKNKSGGSAILAVIAIVLALVSPALAIVTIAVCAIICLFSSSK